MKIGIIQQSPAMGGAEEYTLSIILEFKKSDHEIYFASNKSIFLKKARDLKVKCYKIPLIMDFSGNIRGLIKSSFFLPYVLIFYFNLFTAFKKERVDVILTSNFSEKLLVTFLSVFYKIPVVWVEYGPLKTIFKRNFGIPKLLYVLAKNIPKRIIVPSRHTYESLVNDAYVSKDKLILIPCGVKIGNKTQAVERIPALKDKFVIGNASRLTREKGQQFIINAMPEILKSAPDAVLLLVGGMGPDKEYFENLAAGLGIKDKVIFTGYVKNTANYYNMMDVFVFPTIWELEGFGLVVIEAMSHKIPVIASDFGPVPEIVQNDKNGILVNPENKSELTNAVVNLSKDKSRRDFLVHNAFSDVKNKFNIEITAKQILEVLHESLNKPNKSIPKRDR